MNTFDQYEREYMIRRKERKEREEQRRIDMQDARKRLVELWCKGYQEKTKRKAYTLR